MTRKDDHPQSADLAARARRDGATDEKLKNLNKVADEVKSDVKEVKKDVQAGFEEHGKAIKEMDQSLRQLIQKMADDAEKNFVTKAEFYLVRSLVYGFVAVILLAFLGGLTSLVFIVK